MPDMTRALAHHSAATARLYRVVDLLKNGNATQWNRAAAEVFLFFIIRWLRLYRFSIWLKKPRQLIHQVGLLLQLFP